MKNLNYLKNNPIKDYLEKKIVKVNFLEMQENVVDLIIMMIYLAVKLIF